MWNSLDLIRLKVDAYLDYIEVITIEPRILGLVMWWDCRFWLYIN